MIKGQVLYAKESGSQILFDEIRDDVIYAHVRTGNIDYPVQSLASILGKGYWQEIYTQYQVPETFEKHGSHDQSSHGSWARGVGLSPDVASKIQQFTREWGGLTISMVDGSMPDSGYVVAKPPEFGKVVEEADFFDPVKGPEILADYLIEHQKDLGGKNYLGTWVKDGKVYLDVAENIQDKDVATQIGRERNQLAIWDVVNLQEIDTGGTGLVEKESQHGRITRPDTNDRRANSRVRKRDSQKTNTVRIKFAPNLKPLLKHGSHDQSSHGSWAKAGIVTDLLEWSNTERAKFGSKDNHEKYLLDNILSQRVAGFTGREYYPAVDAYQASHGYTINEALRDPNITTASVQPWIDGLDGAIKDAPPLISDTTVYRGVQGSGTDFFKNLNVGDVYEDKGFASTSLDADIATTFATIGLGREDGLVLRMNLPKGTKGLFPTSVTGLSSLSSRESEFLLPRNSKFKILSNQGRVWDVEVVND